MIEATLQGRTSSAPGKAIMCMLLGSAFLISNDAVLKWMTGNYHVGQLLFCRGIFIGLPLAILIWRAGGLKSLRVVNPKDHAIRAILVIIGTFLFISSLKYLPIADAVAITFAGPLFVTALAPRLLGERVGWRRWMAVFAGFIGIVVIMRPGGGLIQWAALLPLAASLSGAFRDILTRHMSAKETTVSLLFYTSLAVTLAGLATTPFVWTPVPLTDWGWFALSGLLVGGAHFLMIETFRFGEAALVAPFRYSGVIWAALIGYFVWGDIPDSGTTMGISIVVISGIYILHRQRVRKNT
jgi:drug/metabolite transporter (DMT)-like permease